MLFHKQENKKKHHPGLTVTVTALSVLGACTVFCAAKDKCATVMNTVRGWFPKSKPQSPAPFCDGID